MSRDAVINLKGTNSFSTVLNQAARDVDGLINKFKSFGATGLTTSNTLKKFFNDINAGNGIVTQSGNALNAMAKHMANAGTHAQNFIQKMQSFGATGLTATNTLTRFYNQMQVGNGIVGQSGNALANMQRSLANLGTELTTATTKMQSFGTTGLTSVNTLSNTMGQFTAKLRTDLTASISPLQSLNDNLTNLGNTSTQTGSKFQGMSNVMGRFRGAIFSGTGMLTAGIEAVGMLQNLEMSAERVTEAQENLNRITEEGGSGSREHASALRELANANRAYNFQQRITFLSISDMIPFTLNLVNSLSNMGIGLGTVTKAMGKFTDAIKNMSFAMKGALVGTGIGIALVAAGLLFEHFSQKAEATGASTSKALQDIQKASEGLSQEMESEAQSVTDVMTRLERSTAINSALIRQNLIDAIPAKEDTEMDLWEQFLNLFNQKVGENAERPRGRSGGIPGGPEIENTIEKTAEEMQSLDQIISEGIATIESMDSAMVTLNADMFSLGEGGAELAAQFGITRKMTDEQEIQFLALTDALVKARAEFGYASPQVKSLQLQIAALKGEVMNAPLDGMVEGLGEVNAEMGILIPEAATLQAQLEGVKGGFQEVTDAENAMLPKSQDVTTTLGIMGETMAGNDQIVKSNTQSFDEWFRNLMIAGDETKQFNMELETTTQNLFKNLDISKLSSSQMMELLKVHSEGGDVLGTYNEMIEANTKKIEENKDELEGWSQAVMQHMKLADDASTPILTMAEAAGEATIQFNDWDEELRNNIRVADALRPKLINLANELGIDLPAGIKLTNEQLKQLIQAYRETGTAAGAMADIHADVFGDLHKIMTDLVDKSKEGGKEFSQAWKDIKDSIPKDERKFFKGFVEDIGEMHESNDTLRETAAALDLFLDIYGGVMSEDQQESWSKKLIKDIKDLNEQADDLDSSAFNLDAVSASLIEMAKNADTGAEFRVIIGFINDLNEAVESNDANKIAQITTQLSLFTGSLEMLGNVISDRGAATYAAEIETILNPFNNMDLNAITLPTVVEPGDTDAILDKYRNKIQSLGTDSGSGGGGGGKGGSGNSSAAVEGMPDQGVTGAGGIFSPVVMPAPDFESEFAPGMEAALNIVADFNTNVQTELSALHEAGIQIVADFNSSIQEEFSALWEAGTEIFADLNSSIQSELSALWEAGTEIVTDMIETMQDSFDSLDTGDAVSEINALKSAISSLKSKTVTVKVNVKDGGSGRQHGGLDVVTSPQGFNVAEHHIPEIVHVVKAQGKSMFDGMGGDANRLINGTRRGGDMHGMIEQMRRDYNDRISAMIRAIVRASTRPIHVTMMTPNRKVLADQIINDVHDNIGSYRGR